MALNLMVNQYGIDGTDPDHSGKFALVAIHTGGTGGTTFWGGQRQAHYGTASTPDVYFDGVTRLLGGGSTVPAHFNDQETAFLARRGTPTDVTIDLSAIEVSGLQYEITANVCIEAGGTAKTMRVFIVQDLDWYPTTPTYYRNAFREPASTYTGSYEDITLNPGECQQVVKTIDLNITGGIEDNIKLVAWAQEPTTGLGSEAYQAAITVWPFMADCNGNGIPDECDIDCGPPGGDCDVTGCGESDDCNTNGIPDECDLASGASQDCQPNGTLDECDIDFGTSEDCNLNDTPDECEAGGTEDCNGNSTTDLCDIFLGTSQDCQPNLIPDECDISTGTSIDCTTNGIPDECEDDCNTNGVRDDCDIEAGTSGDCNTNGRPDECDVARCENLWGGFNGEDAGTPLHGLDIDGDGIAWDNPADTAEIYGGGCETGSASDKTVQIVVNTTPPELGYAKSEYFLTDNGVLGPDEQIFSLSFRPKVFGSLEPEDDWQISIHDGTNDEKVALIQFSSAASTMTGCPGFIAVKDPLGGYIDTGVEIGFLVCYDIEVVLDNALGTVEVYIDGQLRATTTRLESNAHRIDYCRLQAVDNGGTSIGAQKLRVDYFGLCLTGSSAVPPSEYDCNGNTVLDECDIADGTSEDCYGNGIPDECELGDFDDDGDVSLSDYEVFQSCFTGPDGGPLSTDCELGDFDCDADIDLGDFAGFQTVFAETL